MKHHASEGFWSNYHALPDQVRALAEKNVRILKADRSHPSLQFKKLGKVWSARVGLHYRALGVETGEDVVWFWIGHHAEYDRLVASR